MKRWLTTNPKVATFTTSASSSSSSLLIRTPSLPTESSDPSSENSETEADEAGPTIKKQKTYYKQKFRNEWRSKFGNWCEVSADNNIMCKVCNKNIIGGAAHISRHQGSLLHTKNIKKAEKTPKITSFAATPVQKTRALKAYKSEMLSVMFLHEHNLPFLLMDHLPKFLQAVCPDSQIAKDMIICRQKATLVTKDCFAVEALKVLSQKINDSPGYSLIIDECTDINTEKTLVVVARFFDIFKVHDHFLGLLEIKDGNAQEIYTKIVAHLQNNNIAMEKMIGLAADNASVMMGNINGVKALFRKDNHNLFVLGCVCHSFHLCSSAASSKLPKSIEEFARGIYNYFSNSSKRQRFLKECQGFLEEKPHQMLRPSQTRWLSLQAVINRILQHWESLILVFQDAVLGDNLRSVTSILENLKNVIYKSEHCKIFLLGTRIRSLFRTILRNFVKKEYLDNTPLDHVDSKDPRNFLALEEIYFGANVQILLNSAENIDQTEVKNFKLCALQFYIELCTQIKMRFTFNDPIWNFCELFTPQNALSGHINTIIQSVNFFPKLVTNIQDLDTEWRLLSDCEELKKYKDLEFEEFWCKVFEQKNQTDTPMFPNLSILVKGIMCLPHSSAAAERQFSQYNLIRTKTRNRLLIDTSDAILHSKNLLRGETCYSWAPSDELLKRKPNYRPT